MSLKKYTTDIFKKLNSDETLLRLLYYKPLNKLDNPLDPAKQNILDKPTDEKWDIIDSRIVTAPKFDDLTKDALCRLLVYPGYGRPTNSNYLFSNQEYYFEIFTHFDFENTDRRSEWICDRINELIFNERVAGMGKVLFTQRQPINAPSNYIGYRLIYEFVSENY